MERQLNRWASRRLRRHSETHVNTFGGRLTHPALELSDSWIWWFILSWVSVADCL